ncbi:phosphotransferase family protein [Cytobacillus purgationiresistens]|uniref:Aminoglycoside phosphotransferase (APT) family kinase protein n=1 Tax=Cytobacillus purgationiresistens TaxID=863449 RepID=A0ABU0AKF6_9BACI|nr:aminoglycoside phosphotransferase family protein [Cytobacillus purgationiresistens]MDQ0271739.1 aminoglycoside phosphotransferase (APT) family kinase protein [Cytobacillus purgationiresistens]
MNLGNPIANGNTAELYRIDNKIVKMFKEHLPHTESLYEAKKQEFAYLCGLDVPKIYEVTEINGRQAILMEYIKGQTVGNLLINNMELAEHYLNVCVNVQMKIHNVAVESDLLEPMSEKLQRQIKSGKNLNELQKNILLRRLDSIQFESRLCHGDFHPYNLILSNDKVTIIDWVDSSAGDIRADVYRTYLLISQLSLELAKMYLCTYCKKSGLSQDEVFQWAPIIAGARLSENVSSENKDRLKKIIIEHCY